MTIHELLEHFRREIYTPRDRGTAFERLMQCYLQKDALYKDQFKSVWMWSQWEYKFGNDYGIDLVAEGFDGEFTAIQCKFFDSDHLIQKDDINSFFAESGKQFIVGGKKKSFAQRIVISTSDRWSEPAEKTLDGQTIPVTRIHVRELEQSPIDWSKFSLKKPEDLKLKQKKKLRPHQSEAIEKVITGFKKDDRGKLIMACGTGKTFTALKLAEAMTKGDGLVLFLVPSISLLSQTLREWTAETEATLHAFAVCSDSKVGKHSEDNNKGIDYEALDKRIENTYALESKAKLKKNLYDSYIRAIRWSSDRIGNEGVAGFVTNGSFIEAGNMDGLRKVLPKEFSTLYIFNCRGDQRTAGEQSRQEGGKIFGAGSRTPVAISILVKGERKAGGAEIFYHDIGDYLSREEKLARITKLQSIKGVEWKTITPNADGDWINQRTIESAAFLPICSEKDEPGIFFRTYPGVLTNRDAWATNFSKNQVGESMSGMIRTYNSDVLKIRRKGKLSAKSAAGLLERDKNKISWSSDLILSVARGVQGAFVKERIKKCSYRPFVKMWLYHDDLFNARPGGWSYLFPEQGQKNVVISVIGVVDRKGFSTLISMEIPSLHYLDTSQCFPLYYYEKPEDQDGDLICDIKPDKHGYIRRDAITDFAQREFKTKLGDEVITKEDIFYYVYGLLHSPTYRSRYQNDLKKMLPRIPLCKDFWGYSKTGRALAGVHLNYETCKLHPLKEEISPDAPKKDKDRYRVSEAGMRFPKEKKVEDKTQIIFNSHVRLTGIPLEAYNYVVNGKSAIECVMERYAITTDKDSGIQNDPNEWSDDPRYIVDLVKRVVWVSLETNRLVAQLPPFELLAP